MKTPIYDFVKRYADGGVARFHMPGHKGRGALGCEGYDLTEVKGADVLFSAEGIIGESEEGLTSLYGSSHSYYLTEGSTLGIQAMLRLVSEGCEGERPLILAARNVHKAFVNAAALLDLDVEWIYSKSFDHLCSCNIDREDVERALAQADRRPSAVYVTSPDYLGNMLDIKAISSVCREQNIPLLVDNAHGAYFNFLKENLHPIALGADMCVDSAHKTLPVLTGGAYLHISHNAQKYNEGAREAISVFASTSPSYLTLASLDLCNAYLSDGYSERLESCIEKIDRIKNNIISLGFEVLPSEPLKIVIRADEEVADWLREKKIEPELSEGSLIVLMVTPENTEDELLRLERALSSITPPKAKGREDIDSPIFHERAMSIRAAVLSPSESLPVSKCAGRVCALPTVSCPPAVPIVVSGEIIGDKDIMLFEKYGIQTVRVVKNKAYKI